MSKTTIYELITDVPLAIREFYYEETLSEPTGDQIPQEYEVDLFDEDGNSTGETETRTRMVDEYVDITYVREHVRPETKSIGDLEYVIGLAKPQRVIDIFVELNQNRVRWEFFDEYNSYLESKASIEEHNDMLPVIGQDGDGNDIFAEPMVVPDEPIYDPLSGDDVLALVPSYESYRKVQGAPIFGKNVSLTENNQNGIAAVLKGVELAEKHGQLEGVLPIHFKAQTNLGYEFIAFNTVEEFELFALQFMGERASFFTGE